METFDAGIELAASGLFLVVSALMVRSLVQAGSLNRRNTLALALISIFVLSVPHRALHAYRLLTDRATTDPLSLAVDVLILGSLFFYAIAQTSVARLIVPEERDRFALFADQVGLERLRSEIRSLRLAIGAEQARVAVLLNHLREAVEPMEELRQLSTKVASGPDLARASRELRKLSQLVTETSEAVQDRLRLGVMASSMKPLDELARALSVVVVEADRSDDHG